MLTVACVKARPAYDHRYVNRLYKAVEEHLSIPHRFLCFTDDASGLKCPSRALPSGLKGWWGKLALFRPNVLSGKVLYLDLDTLILDSLDFVGSYGGDFAILRDFYRPEGYGSGVMLWNKPNTHVWTKWLEDGRPEHGLGDQGWMEEMIPNSDRLQDVFPGKFTSFKVHCESGPQGSVVSFHGYPKPHDLPEDHWAKEIWIDGCCITR